MTKRTYVNFKVLKEHVSLEQVLTHYGLMPSLIVKGDRVSGCCPICKSQNQTSFRGSLTKNIWNCFSSCPGGNILDFVRLMEDTDIRGAALMIQEWFNLDTRSLMREAKGDQKKKTKSVPETEPELDLAEAPPELEATPQSVNPVLTFELKSLDPEHPYLFERGLNPDTIQEFGLGYCNKGIMRGRIAIPIHNRKGERVAYAGRLVGEPTKEKPRYKFPQGFEKELELFNLHRALPHLPAQPLILVEGFFSCIKLWQMGYPTAVALMGTSLSESQLEDLVELEGLDGSIHLCFDSDQPGIEASTSIAYRLSQHMYVRTWPLPRPDIGPDDCTQEELAALLP